MQTIDIRKLLKDPSLFKEESFINGKWVKSGSGATFPINNPANNDIIAQVANLDAD
jgi:succinate-semialdehyde dehydrogenase / glutarate-semialdehyde dehydrogenase